MDYAPLPPPKKKGKCGLHALRNLILTANRTVKTSRVLCPSPLVSFLPCHVGNRHVLQDRANSLFPM